MRIFRRWTVSFNWWGVDSAPSDLENFPADFDGTDAIRFLSTWTFRIIIKSKKKSKIGGLWSKKKTCNFRDFHLIIKNAVTSLFLVRFWWKFVWSFLMNRAFICVPIFEYFKNHRRCQAAEFGVHFLSYSAIRTGIKTHADYCNIVFEVFLDDKNRVHALIA